MRSLTWLAALVVMSVGCDKPNEPASEDVVSPPEPATATQEPAAEPVVVPDSLPESAVREVFDAWVATQNTGDFDKYSSVYASKFEGIKRVGARTYRFDRDGWLNDRARMFKKKMSVSADDVSIQTSPKTAIVVFQQTWASGNYKDVGPKQLILASGKDGLQISREEMLQSNVVGDEVDERRAYDPQVMALLADGAVVLDPAPKATWGKGPAKIVSRPTVAMKELDVDASGYGDWIGREMELFGRDGEPCAAKIVDLALRADVVPHFGTVSMWEGEFDPKARASDAEVAAQLWSLASESAIGSGLRLVGKVNGDCNDALWARPKGGPSVPVVGRPMTGPAARNVLSAFTDLPGYHTNQADYAADGNKGAWHEADDATVEITAFGPHVSVSVAAGRGCGSFEGDLWGVWRRGEQQSFVLLTNEDGPGIWRFAPKAAAQIGNNVYFTDGERVVSQVRDSWEVLWHVRPLNLDCGC